MVQLTRIYTRGGDQGKTSVGDGSRIPKHHLRIRAIGDVDELNSALGVALLHVTDPTQREKISSLQNDLFDVGADLCWPEDPKNIQPLRITISQVERLEKEIDDLNRNLEPLNSFVLPGGSSGSTYLHLARTIARRAERTVWELKENSYVNPHLLYFLNRLSDYLFVMARYLNNQGKDDVLWVPGKNLSRTA